MRRTPSLCLAAALWLGLTAALSSPAMALSVPDIVRMLRADIGEEIILRQMAVDQSALHLTAEEILALKEAGASDYLLSALIESGRPGWERDADDSAAGSSAAEAPQPPDPDVPLSARGYDPPGVDVHLYYDPFGTTLAGREWCGTPWVYAYVFPFHWVDCRWYYAGWWPWRWTWSRWDACWAPPAHFWPPHRPAYHHDHRGSREGRYAWSRTPDRPGRPERPGRAARTAPTAPPQVRPDRPQRSPGAAIRPSRPDRVRGEDRGRPSLGPRSERGRGELRPAPDRPGQSHFDRSTPRAESPRHAPRPAPRAPSRR